MADCAAIKQQTRIEQVIGQMVLLKRHGSWYRGRCPFHDDHHPSLIVWPQTQTWKCMTCSPVRDDVIGFIARWYGISTREALAWFASQLFDVDNVDSVDRGDRVVNPSRSAASRSGPLASLADRDAMYHRLIDAWGLSVAHHRLLLSRGLSLHAMARVRFASVIPGWAPSDPPRDGVPGFFRRADHWHVAGPPGLAIPVRAVSGHIQALQIRVDAAIQGKYRWFSTPLQPGGAGSGAPIHVARGTGAVVWITEGPLKAIIAQDRLQHTVLGLPGVTVWHSVPDILHQLQPHEVILALDQDPDPTTATLVAHHRARMTQVLTAAGWRVRQAFWEGPKGLDDALVAHVPIHIATR